MATNLPPQLLAFKYEQAAQEYLRRLPLEHFMEAIAQAKQREITLESLAILKVHRPDVQVFNELLVQYPLKGRRKPGQVVPDNMVILSKQPSKAMLSFNVPLEPAGPFWVMEHVSQGNKRKDYDDSFRKYERDLKVPYYLLFNPGAQELTLFKHAGEQYSSVPANAQGRHPIPELHLEIGLLEGWVRYWYQGQLLPLPDELQRELDETKRRADEQQRRADDLQHRLDGEQESRRLAEQELARLRGQASS
jgi:Uma2 family endonuclease